MAWIESHQSLSRHRKTIRVAKLLKTDRMKVIGHLHELWWWAIDNADLDGNLEDMDHEDVAAAAGWLKNGAAFTAALIDAGFVDADGPNLILHDWYEYAGKLYDQRAIRRQGNKDRQQKRRDKLRTERDTSVTVTRDERDEIVIVTPLPNQPNQPNQEAKASLGANAPRSRGVTPLTEDERGRIKERWEGSLPDWKEVLDLALSHESHKKYPQNQFGYANNWLRRECEGRKGNGNGRTRTGNVQQRPDDEDPIERRLRLDAEREGTIARVS